MYDSFETCFLELGERDGSYAAFVTYYKTDGTDVQQEKRAVYNTRIRYLRSDKRAAFARALAILGYHGWQVVDGTTQIDADIPNATLQRRVALEPFSGSKKEL